MEKYSEVAVDKAPTKALKTFASRSQCFSKDHRQFSLFPCTMDSRRHSGNIPVDSCKVPVGTRIAMEGHGDLVVYKCGSAALFSK